MGDSTLKEFKKVRSGVSTGCGIISLQARGDLVRAFHVSTGGAKLARSKEADAAKAAGNEEEAEAPAKTKKDPKPEGYVSPVEFAKLWSCVKAGTEPSLDNYAELDEQDQIRPQIIYGYVRNNKDFAEAAVETNTDGRLMVNVNAGLSFLTQRDADRTAKKAAKEAEAAEAAAE